jgi:hypothetical protein
MADMDAPMAFMRVLEGTGREGESSLTAHHAR